MTERMNLIKCLKQAHINECPECGTLVSCGIEKGKSTCWCFNEKNVEPKDGANYTQCLCKKCMLKCGE